MKKYVIYLNDEFKNIDFKNLSNDELTAKGFKKSVPVIYKNKEEFNIDTVLKTSKQICESAKTKLIAVITEELNNEITSYFYNI